MILCLCQNVLKVSLNSLLWSYTSLNISWNAICLKGCVIFIFNGQNGHKGQNSIQFWTVVDQNIEHILGTACTLFFCLFFYDLILYSRLIVEEPRRCTIGDYRFLGRTSESAAFLPGLETLFACAVLFHEKFS